MDTGSTLYKKFQKQLARKKHLKRKDAAAKAAKTRKENQRKRNEEAGLGYFSDNYYIYYLLYFYDYFHLLYFSI